VGPELVHIEQNSILPVVKSTWSAVRTIGGEEASAVQAAANLPEISLRVGQGCSGAAAAAALPVVFNDGRSRMRGWTVHCAR
jgi:hypothetical protein